MPSLNFFYKSTRLPRLIKIYFLIDIGLCIAYIMNYLLGSPYSMLTRILDLNDETSLSSWYSSMQLFCIFILGAIFVYHKFRQNSKSLLLIPLPTVFLLMSIDESVQIHEWLGRKSDILFPWAKTFFPETGIWMFLFGLPFFALFLLWAYSTKQYFSEKPFKLKKLVIGMCILLFGALGFESLSNFVENSLFVAEVVFEEGLEMIGATVILWSVYDMALEYIPGMDQNNV